jgi:hypothetical protein
VGPLRESGDSWLGKSGSGYVASRYLQGYSSPHMSIKDRSVGPREQVLNVPIACRWYVPGMPSSQLSTELNFFSLLFDCCGREAGYGPADQMVIVLWIVSGALLLGCRRSVQICWRRYERLLYVDRVRYVWSWTIHGLSVESVWRVGRVSSCRVYIDSNRRDSQTWVTACLCQSSRS